VLRRREIHIGKEEIIFMVAVGGLVLMTIGAVFFKRSADTALVTGFIGLLGFPVFLNSSRKDDESDT